MRRIALALAIVGVLGVGTGRVALAQEEQSIGPSCIGVLSRALAQAEPGLRAEFQQAVNALAKGFGLPPGSVISELAKEHCGGAVG